MPMNDTRKSTGLRTLSAAGVRGLDRCERGNRVGFGEPGAAAVPSEGAQASADLTEAYAAVPELDTALGAARPPVWTPPCWRS